MSEQLKKFEAKVITEWLDDATCAAWRKWHDKSVTFWSELTCEQLAVPQLAPGQRVLDLASGTGDLAHAVAAAVGPAEEVWTRQYEISVPLRPYFNSFAPADFTAAVQETIAGYAARYDGREVTTHTAIVVATATK